MTFSQLRDKVSERMGAKRLLHTDGVVNAARYIGRMCLPDAVEELSVAAILHDVSKEVPYDEQIRLLAPEWESLTDEEKKSPEIFHSYTAPYVIKRDFPELATDKILSAVRAHTVGSSDMSVFDEIIFIADYVEDGRSYSSCKAVREFLYSSFTNDIKNNLIALHKGCIMAIDFTEAALRERGAHFLQITEMARCALLGKIS